MSTPVKLSNLLSGVNHSEIVQDVPVLGVAIDSRQVSPGFVFVAVEGEKVHGLNFLDAAVVNGASVALVDHQNVVSRNDIIIIGVENLKQNISKIAGNFFANPSEHMSVIGVTGTNGKSTVVSLVAQLATLLGKKAATIGTLGYGPIDEKLVETGMTTPDALSCQRMLNELRSQDVDMIAMEVSSHGIDQHRVEAIRFSVSVLTNVTRDHLDYHGSFEAYAAVKASFVDHSNCRIAVINIDDPECDIIADTLRRKGRHVVTFSQQLSKADVLATNVEYTLTGFKCELKSIWGTCNIESALVGAFNVSNVLAAIAACCALGEDFEQVCEFSSNLKAVAGRMQKVLSSQDTAVVLPSVFVDYAHTPDALENALKALKPHVKNKLWVVFGCGGDRDKGKRPLMGAVAQQYADQLVITSDNPRTENAGDILQDIQAGLNLNDDPAKFICIVDRKRAIEYALQQCANDDCVLVAGKGHEDYQIIGHEKLNFDDYLIARKILKERIAKDVDPDSERSGGEAC